MFSLTSVRPTYQAIDRPPIHHVATSGVRYRGLTLPNVSGMALARAIDRAVREVGRIVVCVDAAADVRTAMITIFPRVSLPNTEPARTPSTSSAFSGSPSRAGPA